MKTYNRLSFISLFILLMTFAPQNSTAQVQTGIGFLKLNPGARLSGIAGTTTGNLDFTESFYVNPGATGLSREWQWSVSYTNWISDLYHANFLYGRNFRTPWSRFTRVIVGLNYLGVPSFDSTDELQPGATGSDMLVTMSLGQPLSFIHENISVGVNLKYLRSELDVYDANAFISDYGLLARTKKISAAKFTGGFFDYAILSAGGSITNVGKSVAYISEGTPLPRTLQAGVAINLGSHDGFQISLTGDLRQVRDEDSYFSFGSELSWRQLATLRFGYTHEHNLLGSYTFGASFRLDDRFIPGTQFLPGRNNALCLDMAANQNDGFTSSPFHGTITHIPVGPESFRLTSPKHGALVDTDTLVFRWERDYDRDLYDRVNYFLIVSDDSLKLQKTIEAAESDRETFKTMLMEQQGFLVVENVFDRKYEFSNIHSGKYYWTVAAYDLDHHVRFADSGDRNMGRFYVKKPQLELTRIKFNYHPIITTDDYHGELIFEFKNTSESIIRDIEFTAFDSTESAIASKADEILPANVGTNLIEQKTIPVLKPGAVDSVRVLWHTNFPGLHHIRGELRTLKPKLNVSASEAFYTIPKGTFAAGDSVTTRNITNITYELPYVGKVFFDSSNSAWVPIRFTRKWVIEPLLVTLAKRLDEYPNYKIRLQGTADIHSDETSADIADRRAEAVRDTLLGFGVNPDQIELLPGVMLPIRERLSKNPIDQNWVFQERRRVDIIVEEAAEKDLFKPVNAYFHEYLKRPIVFGANITSSVPIASGHIFMAEGDIIDSLKIQNIGFTSGITDSVSWNIHHASEPDDIRRWYDVDASYNITLTDSLGRIFYTEREDVFLNSITINRERMYFGVAKFALVEPLYNFYWDNLLDRAPFLLEKENRRLRFIGHACAIGSEEINLNLSIRRAKAFYDRYMKDLKEQYPVRFEAIKSRVDLPEGFGEARPFTFKGENNEVILLGDNETPTGRQLNRRVIALIYTND